MSPKASPSSTNPSSWRNTSGDILPSIGRPDNGSGVRPGSSENATSPRPRSSPAAPTKIGGGKRLACDHCRERKVRCNREQPRCGRCTKLGHECKYTTPAKQHPSQMDVSNLLLTLHSRLEQTEARLAMNAPPLDLNPGMIWDPIPSNVDFQSLNFMDMQRPPQQVPSQPVTSPDMTYFDNLDIDQQTLQSDNDTWGNLALENDANLNFSSESQINPSSLVFDQLAAPSPFPSEATSTSIAFDEEIPLQTLKILHYAYFDVAHHTMPIINQDRFSSKLRKPTMLPQLISLSYAMATLGASLMDGYAHIKDKCYQLSRKYFEICEREEDGANLVSIEALQACILITHYELRGRGFARAWMTLGRAIRLAQMMGLDRMDAPDCHANGTLKFQQTLPPARSQLDLEERRNAFWVLFIIDAYASVRSGTAVAIDGSKVSTALPCPRKIFDANSPPMPSLENAQALYGTDFISSFTGLVLMVSLYRRCLNHIKSSLEPEPPTSGVGYGFWEQHYRIDKALQSCTEGLTGKMDMDALLNDEFALALNLNLCAIDIFLHEAAVVKADKDALPKALIIESNNRCNQAAIQIAERISLSQKLAQPQRATFRQMNIFCLWPVCMAMHVLYRQLSPTNTHNHTELGYTVSVLKLLASAIEDLEDVNGHWLDSVSHIVKRLDDLDSSSSSCIPTTSHTAEVVL